MSTTPLATSKGSSYFYRVNVMSCVKATTKQIRSVDVRYYVCRLVAMRRVDLPSPSCDQKKCIVVTFDEQVTVTGEAYGGVGSYVVGKEQVCFFISIKHHCTGLWAWYSPTTLDHDIVRWPERVWGERRNEWESGKLQERSR